MRFRARLLLVCLCSLLFAVTATAQTDWLSDMTAILINDDSPAVVDDIRLMIESQNGSLVLHAPPGVLLAQLPDSGVAFLTGHPNIRKISKTALNAATEGITDENARRAIDYFNWVVTGGADTAVHPPDPDPFTAEMPAQLAPPNHIVSTASEVADDHRKLGVPLLVNVVFIDGAGSASYTPQQKDDMGRAVMLSMTWWNSRLLAHYGTSRPASPSFFTIKQYSVTVTSGDPSKDGTARQWANEAVNKLCGQIAGLDCSWYDPNAALNTNTGFHQVQYNVREFNRVTRERIWGPSSVPDSFTAFVVNQQVTAGISEAGGYVVSLGGAWWSVGNSATVPQVAEAMAHETAHLYWACDEYADSGPTCDACTSVPGHPAKNGNADIGDAACAIHKKPNCLMRGTYGAFNIADGDFEAEVQRVCWFTRQQIGWVEPACYTDVPWDNTGAGVWEGQYFLDSYAPRMPVVHWAGAPELVQPESGTTNGLARNFTSSLTSSCLGASAGAPRNTKFSARYRRKMSFPSGEYEFSYSTGSLDDEVKVYVNGLELKPSAITGKFEVIKSYGQVWTIQIDYYQNSGANPSFNVSWTSTQVVFCNNIYRPTLAPAGGVTDLCNGPIKLLVAANGGTPPYRVAVQRNNDTPVTYDMPTATFELQPSITSSGDSRFKIVSMVDANHCPAADLPTPDVTMNVDSFFPRLGAGGIKVEGPTNCAYRLSWNPATACPVAGGTIAYTLRRFALQTGVPTVETTPLNCSALSELTDSDIQAGKSYQYLLNVLRIPPGKTCADGLASRVTLHAQINGSSCPGSTTALTTPAVTTSYGNVTTLTARLTGNGSALAGKTITFELGGNVVGTGTTNASGDASVIATMTLPVGTHASGVVARYDGDATWKLARATNSVTVSSTCTPPTITAEPADKTITSAGSWSLSLTAAGTAPLTVRWYRADGVYIGGGNPQPVSPTVTTQYFGTVSNGCRTTQSKTVTVTICNPPAISVQPIGGPTVVSGTSKTLSVNATGTDTLFYRWYKNGVAITGATASSYTFTATASASYSVVVTNGCGSITSATAAVEVCSAAPAIAAQPQNASILYGANTTLSVTASGVTPAYQWYQGSTAITGANSSTVNVAPTVTTTYKVVVSNTCGAVTSNTVTVSVCKPPAITANPANAQINSGQSATLNAGASGTSLSYQWYYSNGTTVNGATGSSATLSPTVTTSYYMKATNSCGTAQTATRTVTVCTPPTITTEPRAAQINAGQSYTLTCYASSNVGETYQWYLSNGASINGATGNSLLVSPTATTSYYCVVTNPCGSDTSRTVAVSICEPLTILQQPADKTISAGQPATMTAQLYGSSPWSLQWYENGVAMSGRTAAGTTVYPIVTTTYYLRGTNSCGSVQSRTVTVTVNP